MEKTTSKNVIIGFLSTGKLGSLVMKSLLQEGYVVKIVTRNKKSEEIDSLKKLGAEIHNFDFVNYDAIKNLLTENCSIYIGNIYLRKINENIIELIKKSEKKIRQIIFISGANPREISRAHGELEDFEKKIIQELPISTILKPTMIFGLKDDKNIERIIKFLKKSPFFPIVGNGKTYYQPIHYLDLKNIILLVFKKNNLNGKRIKISGRDKIEYEKIIKIIRKKIKSKSILIKLPQKLLYFLSLFIEKIFRFKMPTEKIKNIHIDRSADNDVEIKNLNYNIQSFESRLDESLNNFYD